MDDLEKKVTSVEMSSQVVRREGADEMLAFMEGLDAEKTAVSKAVAFLNAWHPEDIDKVKEMTDDQDHYEKQQIMEGADRAMKMARSVKDPMRLVLNHVQFYKGIEFKSAKAKGETSDPLEGLSDDQIKKLAQVIKGEAIVVPTEKEVTATTEAF